MVSIHGIICKELQKCWYNLRLFAYLNRTIFEVVFILIYSIEQVLLVYFAFNAKGLESFSFIVSIFAIIVLTTFAFHKLLMESRIKMLENEVNGLLLDKTALESHVHDLKRGYDQLVHKASPKYLKTWNYILPKKR